MAPHPARIQPPSPSFALASTIRLMSSAAALTLSTRWSGHVDQVIQRQPGAVAVLPVELLPDLVHRAADLGTGVLVPVLVALDEPGAAFRKQAVLLLDQEHIAALVDDDEVHLAEVHPLGVLARPVHTVQDRVVVRQGLFQIRKGGEFTRVTSRRRARAY